jgi:hypothetical protein
VEKLNAALARALADLTEPHKGGKANAGQYAYTYLQLNDLSRVVREAFARHGLAFTQHVETFDGGVSVTTRVLHESGVTWRTEPLVMPVQARTPQGFGSGISYARRYQLAALVGLSGTDDDDGAQATGREVDDKDLPRVDRRGSSSSDASRPVPTAAPEPHAESDQSPGQTSHAASHAGKRGSGAAPTSGKTPKRGPTGDHEMTDPQRRRLWATARARGYGDKKELAAFVCGLLEVEYDEERLSSLTKAEASRVIDALQAEVLAERLDGTPPDDPWATEQAVMAE